MDAPVTAAPRSADHEDRLVEMFAALALIAPDRESIGKVVSLAVDLQVSAEPAPASDEPVASAPNL